MPLDLISSKRLTMNKLVSKNLSTQLARHASSERSILLLILEIHLSYFQHVHKYMSSLSLFLPITQNHTYPTVISHVVNSFLDTGFSLLGFEELMDIIKCQSLPFYFVNLKPKSSRFYKIFTWASSR